MWDQIKISEFWGPSQHIRNGLREMTNNFGSVAEHNILPKRRLLLGNTLVMKGSPAL